jgi:NAD(P)-dependent dehydrogenase (short-subunit alcohol dehydrogenase family)
LIDGYQDKLWHTVDLSRNGTGLHHLTVDLANIDHAWPLIEAQFQSLAKTQWGRVVFINNAGLLTPIAPVRSVSDEQIVRNLDVNLLSAVRLISCFVRLFQASQNQITIANISSGAALKGYAGWSLYCTAKAGMENFIRALAAEQNTSAKPMTCINIDPGKMDTDMQVEIRDTDAADFPSVARFIDAKESGQLRSASFVAEAVMRILDDVLENGERYRIPGAA